MAKPRPLPASAQAYLRKHAGDEKIEQAVHRFHSWMDWHRVAPSALDTELVDTFFNRPFRKLVQPRTARSYKRALIGYLEWQYDKGVINFDPKMLAIRHRRPLPESAEAYARSLSPTHKPTTLGTIKSSLRRFHEWLADSGIRLRNLRREQIQQWFFALNDEGLHAATRRHQLVAIRGYLRWANEHGELRRDADDLVRTSDLPKLPRYLPRPLLPEEDRILQHRLQADGGTIARGLLLMRWTGLRIGELARLDFDCMRDDASGNTFIHVPLGKMNNERLVPIDARIRRLVGELRGRRRRHECKYLLEKRPGRRIRYDEYRAVLKTISEDLGADAPITTHRLRHTYATTLLGAGMSLTSVMKLLGHVDYRMTLRYAAITQPIVTTEYFEAVAKLEARYSTPLGSTTPLPLVQIISDVMRRVRAELGAQDGAEKLVRSLLRRLERIRRDLEQELPRSGAE